MKLKEYNMIAHKDVVLIAELVMQHTGLNIFKDTRKRNYVEARSIFYHILKTEYNTTYHFIEDFMEANGKPVNHATVLHSVNNFESYALFNKNLSYVKDIVLKAVENVRYNVLEELNIEIKSQAI